MYAEADSEPCVNGAGGADWWRLRKIWLTLSGPRSRTWPTEGFWKVRSYANDETVRLLTADLMKPATFYESRHYRRLDSDSRLRLRGHVGVARRSSGVLRKKTAA